MRNHNECVSINEEKWQSKALEKISVDGVAVLRGIVNDNDMHNINKKVKNVLSHPSLLGSVGYYQKDPYKNSTMDFYLVEK